MKKNKKFKRGHLWASVIFLVCSLICTIVVIVAAVTKISEYSINTRIKKFYSDSLYVVRLFDSAHGSEEYEKIIEHLKNNPEFAEAAYLLDEKREIITGYGGATYDLETQNSMELPAIHKLEKDLDLRFEKPFSIYLDRASDDFELYILNNGVNLGLIDSETLDKKEFSLAFRTILNNSSEILYEVSSWFGVEISENRFLMVKNRITFYYEDLITLLLIALVVLVMLIPAVFLSCNVIINAVNQKRIAKLLYEDSATKGNNWRYFEEYACKVLSRGRKINRTFAIVDFSVLKYGSYCTFHGVDAGENLLKEINSHLDGVLGRNECVARFGKASFALLLQCAEKSLCERRIQMLVEELARKFGAKGILFHAGIYFVEPEKSEKGFFFCRKKIDVAEFYNCASNARSSITDENQNYVITFDQKLRDEQIWEHKVEERMQSALENEEFKVYIQPKYNPVTEELAGAEALVRWINDEDGFISPGRFIPLFEKNGFITKLDDYMLSHVAKLQATWLEMGKNIVPISVNVSRAHFADPELAQHICEIVDEYKVPHKFIEIELTESAFFDDKAALLNTVMQLKEAGFDISMDDFGAGYSSLNSLKDLPLDVLKLDAEFFRGENGEERGEIVVAQAIDLAKKLNMRIVAEGVEKKEQVDFLAAQNCDMIQGFYFAKPMPAEEYEKRIDGQK